MEREFDLVDVMTDLEMIEQTARIVKDIATSAEGAGDGRSLACDKMNGHAADTIMEAAKRIREELQPLQG